MQETAFWDLPKIIAEPKRIISGTKDIVQKISEWEYAKEFAKIPKIVIGNQRQA